MCIAWGDVHLAEAIRDKFQLTKDPESAPPATDFSDHYFDILTYLSSRKTRLAAFKQSASSRHLSPQQLTTEWTAHTERERTALRKRRTKLRLEQFHIVTQVGQGGYGEVYLARHKETQQVVALKKMKKRTLAKMDEVRFRIALIPGLSGS